MFNQIFINYFLFFKEEKASTSFTFTEINLFSAKTKELFLFSSLMMLISESLQGKGPSSPEFFPIYFRQAKFCYWSHYAILQLRTSLHLSKHKQNLSQCLIFIAINKAKWREKIPNNPSKMLSAIKVWISNGTRISTAAAIVTHLL